GPGARRLDPSGRGAVVRVHHHPAHRRAGGARPLCRARLHRLRRRARRKPDPGARRLALLRRDAALADRPARRRQLGRHLCGATMTDETLSWRRALPVIVLTAACFALTLRVFWPGVMTWDAKYIYSYIAAGQAGDWQSPLMTALWAVIDPI